MVWKIQISTVNETIINPIVKYLYFLSKITLPDGCLLN